MKKLIINILIAVFLLNLSGCATGENRLDGYDRQFTKIYPATAMNGTYIATCFTEDGVPFMAGNIGGLLLFPILLGNAIDLPISITSDTIFLPLDIYRWNFPENQTE
jgi:uncharacterized protein YceK